MDSLARVFLFLTLFSWLALPIQAQFNTPTINAAIGVNEYGNNNDNNYLATPSTARWFMTWDDTYLYIAIENANETQAGIVYLDLDPFMPVNGGTNSNGANIGQVYDNLAAPNLPFRANAILYFKNDYRELRRWNGLAWQLISSGNGGLSGNANDYTSDYNSTTNGNGAGDDDDRELRISWCRLTGGSSNCRPSSFNWFGYISGNNSSYGEAPVENPNATFANQLLSFDRYLSIGSTDNGSSTNPMSRNCYTHIGGSTNFNGISVWDFTMNTASATITRTSGDLNIANDLIISNGTINLGANNNDCIVGDEVKIFSSGTLTLPSMSGGDLLVSGNWDNNGTFNANGRAVFFQGANAQSISGATTFAYLIIDKSANDVFVTSDITVSGNTSNVLQINNNGNLFLFGGSINLSGNGGNILVGGTNGSFTRGVVGAFGIPGRFIFNGNKTIINANDRKLLFDINITVELQSGNIDFGQNSGLYLSQIDGTLDITSTFAKVINNPPTYGSNSFLKYNVGGQDVYNRGIEWSETASPGYPHNVQITGTALNLGALAPTSDVELANDLTIDAGAALLLNGITAGFSDAQDMTAALTIKGSLTLNGELYLSDKPGGDLVLGGQWNKNINGTFVPASRSVTFNGNLQEIFGATTFYTLIQNSPGADDLKLYADVNIINLVEVQSGNIHLNNKKMVLESTAKIIEERTASGYVIMDLNTGANPGGYIEISNQTVNVDATAFDPANEIAGLGLYLASSVASYNDLTVRRYNYAGAGVGVRKTFELISTDVNANPTKIAIQFGEKDLDGTPFDILDIDRMFRYTTSWNVVDATADLGNRMIETDDFQNAFSSWAVGSSSAPLPVNFVSIKAERWGNAQAKITWQTTHEVDNQGFRIEKSVDAQNYQTIGVLDSKANTSQLTDYQWIDRDFNTSAYYRIKQIDKNGTFAYSRIVFAEHKGDETFKVFPNPIQSKINFNLSLDNQLPVQVQILDLQGKVVFEDRNTWQNMQIELNNRALQFNRGVYVLRLVANQAVYTTKFLK
jgi:hypothetical protein